ncbi:MAG: DUF222 domain-containing protein [Microthrixaceae bacterium]
MVDPADPPVSSQRVGALEARTHGERSDAIEQLGALVVAATAEMLDVITAADRQRDWKTDGATSMTAWLVAMLHVSHTTAKEWVRVGAALDALPHLRDAFSAGMLSWDQIRHATIFVTPDHDETAAQNLPGHTAAQIEEIAKFARARTRRDATRAKDQQMLTWRKDADNGGFHYRGFLPAENGALVNAALEQRSQRIGKDPVTGLWGAPEARYADALVDLARQDLHDKPGPDPTVVVVHVNADTVDGTTMGNGSIQGIPIPADTVRRLLCDCEIDYSINGPDGTCTGIGRAGRTPPRWLRRQLLHRDSNTCRFPGCNRPIRHLHHIQHWIRGGATDSWNLAGLCWEHHHLVHEGGWTIEGNPDTEITFTSPHGRTLASRPRPLDPTVRRRAQTATNTDLHATGADLRATGTDPPR